MAKKRLARKRSKSTKPARKPKKAANRKPAKKKVTRRVTRKVKKKVPQRKPARAKKKPKSPEAELQALDSQILALINRRTELTTELWEAMPNVREVLYNPSADEALWQRLQETNPGPMPNHAVRGVFRQVLSAARRKVKMQRVAYLGPPFSYTHLAALERFGEWADLIPVNTIASVFEEVNRGHADFGLVPIENSTDGRVVDTLDMFTRLPLKICGEVQLAIRHNLLARCPRSEVTEIYSKPQALSQCRDWLSRNMPQSKLIDVTSTSAAAQLASQKPGAAAVASRLAAIQYDLQIIAEDIQDNKGNITRFAVIGEEECPATGKDRTAILLQIPHKPGSLSDALVVFKKNKINLTWIESFPLRGPETGYVFFLDFEGHISDARTKRTLGDLERKAVRLEVLGSYPRSDPLD